MPENQLLKKFGFEKEEVWEEFKDQFLPTGFPAPAKRFKLVLENFNMSIEESYFWILNSIRDDWGYTDIIKTEDVFAAAENSAFFGVTQQRVGIQQDKVSQFLATIGKMVKELFQLVRELRVIDERMVYYRESWGIDDNDKKIENFPDSKRESAELTLKGIWIDMVQGGSKNPASVFGLAREVGFVALPDLFFSTNPKTSAEVDEVVDTQRAGFNPSVKNALKRQLKQFIVWKEKTYDELKTRRLFTLKYLRQHYDIIKMYMAWIRPYIKHIRKLTNEERWERRPDLISSFEGSMLEVEFLATKLPVDDKSKKSNKHVCSCILAHFLFRTRPSMSYQQEGYQRGPIHVGRLEMVLRAYTWTKKDIENYLKMKDAQDMELLKTISESVKAAMEALGGELEKYLVQAGEEIKKTEEKKEEKKPTAFERLRAEFLGPKTSKPKKEETPGDLKSESETKLAEKTVKGDLFNCFKNYKKAHGMIMW